MVLLQLIFLFQFYILTLIVIAPSARREIQFFFCLCDVVYCFTEFLWMEKPFPLKFSFVGLNMFRENNLNVSFLIFY